MLELLLKSCQELKAFMYRPSDHCIMHISRHALSANVVNTSALDGYSRVVLIFQDQFASNNQLHSDTLMLHSKLLMAEMQGTHED